MVHRALIDHTKPNPAVHSDEAFEAATVEAVSAFNHADASLGSGFANWRMLISARLSIHEAVHDVRRPVWGRRHFPAINY
jgi:hypothetical protein